MLSPTLASRFAAIALANVIREYPGKADHVPAGDADLLPPRLLHPAFYGSYDWHSCVHMHWLLVHVRRLHPALPQRADIDALLCRHLAPANIAAECAYLERPHAQGFERPYGWTWLLKLADELARSDDAAARRWSRDLAPLARAFVDRYLAWLPKADYPVRYGMHSNSAFGVLFALDYARDAGESALAAAIEGKARAWFERDRDAPVAWEPSGHDFLSPALVEALLLRRVLSADAFGAWLGGFLPGMSRREPASLFAPVKVSDRSDAQIVHLDGLNLSRAWCFRGIASALAASDARAGAATEAAASHLAAGIAALDTDDYVGTHWLASFAALALSEPARA
jgi:hypothetical protein